MKLQYVPENDSRSMSIKTSVRDAGIFCILTATFLLSESAYAREHFLAHTELHKNPLPSLQRPTHYVTLLLVR